ncbi:MAG TPA: hypothetical protein VL856_05010, partial [Acidimicrobiia bacterium]|nr:hypothetical protein [Acidimicrobiia bacterium]
MQQCDVAVVEQLLGELLQRLDPNAVPLPSAPGLLAVFASVNRMSGSAMTLIARRVEEGQTWKRAGFRSAAEQLAVVAGTSVTSARTMLETSKQVAWLPATADAMRAGTSSVPKAAAIASAATVAPEAEASLLAGADAPVAAVRDQCLFERARAEGRTETRDAYAFDALLEMARRAGEPASGTTTACSPRSMGLIRADLEALQRGGVEGDEVCEIVGLGPIPVTTARKLLGDAVLKLVLTKGVDVMNVTHLGRSPTVAQQVALWWRSPECTAEGCTRTRRLENDHRIDWVETHHTRLDELDPLCDHEHDLKTYSGWSLVAGTGK